MFFLPAGNEYFISQLHAVSKQQRFYIVHLILAVETALAQLHLQQRLNTKLGTVFPSGKGVTIVVDGEYTRGGQEHAGHTGAPDFCGLHSQILDLPRAVKGRFPNMGYRGAGR